MEHHHHHHSHSISPVNLNRAFLIGIGLNVLFVCIELVTGIWVDSLSLLSDAGHNLADVGTLLLSLVAFKMLAVKPNNRYTYGYKKTSILAALFNSALLFVSVGAIAYEAIHRLLQPEPIPGNIISIVAGIGIVVNMGTALLFFKNKDHDLNVKGAFLHLLSDAIVSAGLVIGGIIIYYTHYFWIDPLISIIVAVVILISSWSLFRDSIRLSLDGVPEGIRLEEITVQIKKIAGVLDVHHIHVWAISTTQNGLTAHIVVEEQTTDTALEKIKQQIRHTLEHLNIHHATLETESMHHHCSAEQCEATPHAH